MPINFNMHCRTARQCLDPYAPKGADTLAAEAAGDKVLFSVARYREAEFPPSSCYVFETIFPRARHTAHGGSGLGLAIVREIITAHGGSVQCESIPEEKTVFSMSLPLWTNER